MYNNYFTGMKHIIGSLTLSALFLLLVTGCDENAFVKTIDVEQADFPPKLAVTATLDTDSGRFTLFLREAHSMEYYRNFNSEQQYILRNGTVRLFENDVQVFAKPGPFDLSVTHTGQNGYHGVFTGISAVAGRTYRLEIDIDGYDKATATAVMPDAPIISGTSIDIEHPVNKENVRHIESLSYNSSSSSYYDYQYVPFSLNISDNSPLPDFYSFQVEHSNISKYENDDEEHGYTVMTNIATSNLVLIQDNPDVESKDIMMDGENIDLYSFDLMMLTDATFANTAVQLDLFSPYHFYIPTDKNDHNLPNPNPSSYRIVRHTLIARHYTQEAFRQYRSMAFQLAGLGFFSEPVFITTNMENAYGGFSVQNTKRIILSEVRGAIIE
jgi:hypothetical protein